MESTANGSQAATSALYKSPVATHTFEYSIPERTGQSSTAKSITYLADLRKSIVQMQNDVNAFLTNKMEEEKQLEATRSSKDGVVANEDKEEDNYGEEAEDD